MCCLEVIETFVLRSAKTPPRPHARGAVRRARRASPCRARASSWCALPVYHFTRGAGRRGRRVGAPALSEASAGLPRHERPTGGLSTPNLPSGLRYATAPGNRLRRATAGASSGTTLKSVSARCDACCALRVGESAGSRRPTGPSHRNSLRSWRRSLCRGPV